MSCIGKVQSRSENGRELGEKSYADKIIFWPFEGREEEREEEREEMEEIIEEEIDPTLDSIIEQQSIDGNHFTRGQESAEQLIE